MKTNTATITKNEHLNKSELLHWLYLNKKEISVANLSKYLSHKTDGKYMISKTK